MKEELFNQLLGSLREVVAIERGEARPARVTRYPAPDTRQARQRMGLTQLEFSRMIGVSLGTLRNWEQGRRQPHGPARVLLLVAAQNPEAVWDVIGAFRGAAIEEVPMARLLPFKQPRSPLPPAAMVSSWYSDGVPAKIGVSEGSTDERTGSTA
jgi:putative transcriptional regulator